MATTPILNYTPGGGVPIPAWPPFPTNLTYPECGIIQLVSGQSWIDVTFTGTKPDANWTFEELQIVNTIDPTPLNIWPGIVTDKTITGFRIQLNGLPNTDNYFLHWAVGGCATSDWVVSGAPASTNFLQLTDTPNDYIGQAGMGVTVNPDATGLDFTVAAAGGMGSPNFFNVLDFGAKGDCVTLFDITMPNGNVVTSAAHTFTEEDIGKVAIIRGATMVIGASSISPLIATITAVSGHTATLSRATTSALTNINADSFPRMDFGTNNLIPFLNASFAVPGPGQRNHDLGTPFTGSGVMNPVLSGDGGTIYIPRGRYLHVNLFPTVPGETFWFIETNNLVIKGDGMGQTVLLTDSLTYGTMPLWGGFVVSHGRFQNWIVTDMTFYDLNYYTGGGNSLNIHEIDNLLVQRIEICNSRGNGGINVQGYPAGTSGPVSKRLAIRDCWVHGITEDGHSPSFPYSIEGDGMNVGEYGDVHIEGNTIHGGGRHGYEGGGMCRDQYFYGNTIDMGGGGLSGINPTGGNTTVIVGNTVKNVAGGWFGIDCTVDSGAFTANNIRVIGNYVSGPCQGAFRFQNTSGDLTFAHVDNIIVSSNWVEHSSNPSEVGVLVGGGGTDAINMLIEGNWFGHDGLIFSSVNSLPATGCYIIIKNNFCKGRPLDVIQGEAAHKNIFAEGNLVLGSAQRYGGYQSCGIDSQTIAAGATYSATAASQGPLTTDSVEIVRGATTAGGLIIWGQVTAANVITTYAYNPTGASLNTGATCYFIVHRMLPT